MFHFPFPFVSSAALLAKPLRRFALGIASTAALLLAQDQPRVDPPTASSVATSPSTAATLSSTAATLSSATTASSAATPRAAKPLPPGVTRVALVFSGGHELNPGDHGRPVVLIAAALGVKAEVFREAFGHVHPAGPGSGGPTESEARANKQALMKTLGPYGVTDARLNEVSNYYRYASWKGGRWKTQPATGNALVKDGAIVGYELTSGGAGYTTPPAISVPSFSGAAATTPKATLAFGMNLAINGSVATITAAPRD